MESKYYAPSDDEFRIGFEFYSVEEIDGSINGPYTIKDCYDLEVQARNCWKNYSDILIKYLDKEDIESLGFKDHNGESHIYEENNVIGFVVWNGKDEYTIKYDTESHVIKSIVHTAGLHKMFNCFFSIKVKNKSELRKLLIQLEIINE